MGWIQLKDFPLSGRITISNALYHNYHKKFLVVVTNHGDVFRYSTGNNWEEYHSIENEISDVTSAISCKRNQIIFMHDYGKLATLTLNDDKDKRKWEIIKHTNYEMDGSSAVVIRDQLHIIGGNQVRKHLRWNEQSQKNLFETERLQVVSSESKNCAHRNIGRKSFKIFEIFERKERKEIFFLK